MCLTHSVHAAVMPGTKLQEHSGSEKAWVYTTVDFADEEQKPELFCMRFASPESERLRHPYLKLSCIMAKPAGNAFGGQSLPKPATVRCMTANKVALDCTAFHNDIAGTSRSACGRDDRESRSLCVELALQQTTRWLKRPDL